MNPTEQEKFAAANRAVRDVRDGMLLGLGSGSTAAYAIRLIGARVRQGLRVRGIPTSARSADLAREEGIPLVTFDEGTRIDLTIDGADELTPDLQATKGGGGALLREKIVATASTRVVIIADSRKVVPVLGRFLLPVEVLPFARPVVEESIARLGGRPRLRRDSQGAPVKTDQDNLILDCDFGAIDAPHDLANQLDRIPGLMEHGLFLDLVSCAVIGRGSDVQMLE